jgi:hypothetical protein
MLELDRPYKLRLGMGAICEFQDLTGIPLGDLDNALTLETGLKALWIMLRQEIPDLSYKDACALVDEYAPDWNTVLSAVSNALKIAFRTKAKSANPKRPRPQ